MLYCKVRCSDVFLWWKTMLYCKVRSSDLFLWRTMPCTVQSSDWFVWRTMLCAPFNPLIVLLENDAILQGSIL